MAFDFIKLQSEIQDATKFAFNGLLEAHSDEHFYAFALYTDDSVISIAPSANSEEGYQRAIINFKKQFGEIEPEDLLYLQWATAEWAYEYVGHEHFSIVNDLLKKAQQNDSEYRKVDFQKYKGKVLSTMVAALHQLDEDGLFNVRSNREELTVFASISDSDEAFLFENFSAQSINPESVFKAFSLRYI